MGNTFCREGGRGRRARTLTLTGAIVAASVAVAAAQAGFAHPEIDFKGKLYRSVFISGPGTLSSGDLADVAEPLRSRLSEYLSRRAAFNSQYEGRPSDPDEVARDAKRRIVARAIVSLIDAAAIETRAVAFVKDAPIAAEWEGRPEGPIAEAQYAEQMLEASPDTPLAPFIHVFAAQRYRAAAEAAEHEADAQAAADAERRYREHLRQARAAKDPMFGLIADDLERVPYVYVQRSR